LVELSFGLSTIMHTSIISSFASAALSAIPYGLSRILTWVELTLICVACNLPIELHTCAQCILDANAIFAEYIRK
jgi:hypothetical protein